MYFKEEKYTKDIQKEKEKNLISKDTKKVQKISSAEKTYHKFFYEAKPPYFQLT